MYNRRFRVYPVSAHRRVMLLSYPAAGGRVRVPGGDAFLFFYAFYITYITYALIFLYNHTIQKKFEKIS